MKAASLNQLKKEMAELPSHSLLDICLRMARYKKENKEFLTYLLFEAGDEKGYIQTVKEEIDAQFKSINKSRAQLAKKGLSKTLRIATKFIKYSGHKQTEIEVLLYFCQKMNRSGIRYRNHSIMLNLYNRQLERIEKAIATLHEDLQYDYRRMVEEGLNE